MMMDRYVKGKLMKMLPQTILPTFYVEPVNLIDEDATPTARIHAPELPAEERRKSYAEVEMCVKAEDARSEACRCLRCDLEFTRPV
jgi:hypothetical protein